jgi:hypothetical protein
MTTQFSHALTHRGIDRQRGLIGGIALWTVQIAVAALFLFAGSLKLTGAPQMVATFDAIGLGQWFRYLTGAIEIGSALALLVPPLAPFGALLLVPTMVGAVATHLFIVGGTPVPAAVLLIASASIVWARRDQLARALPAPPKSASASVDTGEAIAR